MAASRHPRTVSRGGRIGGSSRAGPIGCQRDCPTGRREQAEGVGQDEASLTTGSVLQGRRKAKQSKAKSPVQRRHGQDGTMDARRLTAQGVGGSAEWPRGCVCWSGKTGSKRQARR